MHDPTAPGLPSNSERERSEIMEATMTVDLQLFCGANEILRSWMMEPFSIGEWTYATNGHIAVRVTRRPDVPENADATDPGQKIFAKTIGIECAHSIGLELPPERQETCSKCDGDGEDGFISECEDCDGRGYTSSDDDLSVEVRGAPFAAHYMRMIFALPNVKISDPITFAFENPIHGHGSMLAFSFDGGEGRLMGLKKPYRIHIRKGETFAQASREADRKDNLALVNVLVGEGFLERIDEHTVRVAEAWRA
jgi:hypothetical protein